MLTVRNYSDNRLRYPYFLLSVIVVIVLSCSWADVTLPTDVISVISVVLAMSLRTIGTDSRERFSNGSDSQLLPSNQFLASGPSFRISAYENDQIISTIQYSIVHSPDGCSDLPVARLPSPLEPCGIDNYLF